MESFRDQEPALMQNIMERGQAWLASQLTQHASKKVVYCRDDIEVELSATIGKSEYDQDDGEGIVTRLLELKI